MTTRRAYGAESHDVLRAAGIFPAIVVDASQAVSVLRQFRVDMVVVETDGSDDVTAVGQALERANAQAPLLVYERLPQAAALAAALRDATKRSTTAGGMPECK